MNIIDKIKIIMEGLKFNDQSNDFGFMLNILESMSVGILIINLDSIVLYVNPKYSQITGVSYEIIVGKKLRSVRPGARLPEVLETGCPINNVPRKEKDVEYFVDLSPIYFDNKLIGGVSIMKDIKDVTTMSEELKKFKNDLVRLQSSLRNAYMAKFNFDDIIGNSQSIKKVKELAYKASQTEASIMLIGSSGTGKEMFAHAIHNNSNRKENPFVPINCASIPSNLVESELFGFEDGSFTGAKKGGKVGLFEIADKGTIFLDEIENMDPSMQAKILRVLQEKSIRHVGSNKEVSINVRIISACNVDIEQLVKTGKFREDLYYRLCVIPIYLPNLSERGDDIKPLVKYFIDRLMNKYGHTIEIEPEVYDVLKSYPWPGNVRELQNTIEYAAGVCDDYKIKVDNLPQKIRQCIPQYSKFNNITPKLKDVKKEIEAQVILQYLSQYGNTVNDKKIIANKLGISISTLYNKLKQYN